MKIRSVMKWKPKELNCRAWSSFWIPGKIARRHFPEKIGENKKYRLSEALIIADIAFDEHLHNGLIDARNTALLFVKMEKEPILVLNPYYQRGREEEDVEMNSLASMCPALRLAFA